MSLTDSSDGLPPSPPQIETLEGVGAKYLIWTRTMLLHHQREIEVLHNEIRRLREEKCK